MLVVKGQRASEASGTMIWMGMLQRDARTSLRSFRLKTREMVNNHNGLLGVGNGALACLTQ